MKHRKWRFVCETLLNQNSNTLTIALFHFSQKINEQKLQAFAIGTMGQRPLSRREQEERRKKEEEEAAANV